VILLTSATSTFCIHILNMSFCYFAQVPAEFGRITNLSFTTFYENIDKHLQQMVTVFGNDTCRLTKAEFQKFSNCDVNAPETDTLKSWNNFILIMDNLWDEYLLTYIVVSQISWTLWRLFYWQRQEITALFSPLLWWNDRWHFYLCQGGSIFTCLSVCLSEENLLIYTLCHRFS